MAEKKTQDYLKQIVKTSFFLFFILIVAKLFNYLYKLYIAREFGASDFGLFSLALIVISIVTGLCALGFPEAIVRYVSFYSGKKEKDKVRKILNRSLVWMAASSVIGILFCFIFGSFIAESIFKKPELTYYIYILSFSIPCFLFLSILASLVRAEEKISMYSVFMNALPSFFKLIAIVALVYIGFRETSTIYSYVLSLLLPLLILIYLLRKELKLIYKTKYKPKDKQLFTEVPKYAWPLAFVSLILNIYYWTDSLVIGYFNSAFDVGQYNAAITLIYLFAISQDLFTQIFFPLISRQYLQNKNEVIRDLTKHITKWMYMLNLPLFFLMFFFPGVFLNFFFGQEFLTASPLLKILSVGSLISSLNGILINLLSTTGSTRTILSNFVIFSIFNLIAGTLLILKLDLPGVALATTFSFIGLTIALTLQVKKTFSFFPFSRSLIKITLISVIPFLIMWTISEYITPTLINLFLSLFVFLIFYVGLLYLTRCFDEHDFEILRAMIAKGKFIWKKI